MKKLIWLLAVAACVFLLLAGCMTPVGSTAPPAIPNHAIRAAGDSNTTGHGVVPYPTYVASAIGQPVDNLGISGMSMTFTSTFGGLPSPESIPLEITQNIAKYGPPQIVTILGGTNDFRDWGTRPTTNLPQLESDVTTLDAQLTAQGIDVLWITPPPFGPESGVSSDALADRATYNTWLVNQFPGRVADCGTQLGDDTGAMPAAIDAGDGVHLNAVGQVLLANCVEANLPPLSPTTTTTRTP